MPVRRICCLHFNHLFSLLLFFLLFMLRFLSFIFMSEMTPFPLPVSPLSAVYLSYIFPYAPQLRCIDLMCRSVFYPLQIQFLIMIFIPHTKFCIRIVFRYIRQIRDKFLSTIQNQCIWFSMADMSSGYINGRPPNDEEVPAE